MQTVWQRTARTHPDAPESGTVALSLSEEPPRSGGVLADDGPDYAKAERTGPREFRVELLDP